MSVTNCYMIIAYYVQSTAGRYTVACVRIYNSVINGFLRQGRPDQLLYVFQLANNFLALAAAYRKAPASPPKRDNPLDGYQMSRYISELGGGHLSLVMKSLQFDFSKSCVTRAV